MFGTENIYLINLKHRRDRLLMSKKQLNKIGVNNYKLFQAVDARKLGLTGVNEKNQGLIGCFMSHYILLQNAILNGIKRMVVFEDDVIFCNDFKERFIEEFKQVPNKWELLYLGYYERGESKLKIANNICVPKCTWGTHGYMVQNAGIIKMFDGLQEIKGHIDIQIDNQLVKDIYTYCFSPALCFQSGIKSDIK